MSEKARINANTATVISVLPFPVDEVKPGVYPGQFILPAAKKGGFESILIGPSSYHVYIPIAERTMTIEEHAHNMARSIVDDYVSGVLGASKDARPGLFWVEGTHTSNEIESNFKKELEEARQSQDRWFLELVKLADDDWTRYHMHAVISDLQRYAAINLGLEREWIKALQTKQVQDCKVCRSPIHPDAIVCPVCRSVLNPVEYAKIQKAS